MNYMGPSYFTEIDGFEWDESLTAYNFVDIYQPEIQLIWDVDLNDYIEVDTVTVTVELKYDLASYEWSALTITAVDSTESGVIEPGSIAGVYEVVVPVTSGVFKGLAVYNNYIDISITRIEIGSGDGFWTNFSEQYESASA
jgi:phosphoenolpyruvate carboxylase